MPPAAHKVPGSGICATCNKSKEPLVAAAQERARKRREAEAERKKTAKHSMHAPVRRVILSDSEDEDEEEEEDEEE